MAASTSASLAGLPAIDEAALGPLAGVWLVYMLRCADGTLYTGCTNDLRRRLQRHRQGGVKYTRGRLPIEPVYIEEVAGRSAALVREAAVKKLRLTRKLEVASGARP